MANSEQIAAPHKSRFRKWFFRILLLISLAPFILFAIFWLDYRLHSLRFGSDEKILKEYRPEPIIAEIAEKTAMTERGRAIFYRGDPKIYDQKDIDYHCETDKLIYIKETAGCFGIVAQSGWFSEGRGHGIPVTGDGIFIAKSSSNYYVTGAHEMLHYAYRLLDPEKRERINKLLEAEFQKRQKDNVLVELIDDYRKDGINILTELHSQFGSGYRNLDPELENYYKQYFTDRLKVVELSENFTE